MAILQRQFYRSARGPTPSDEDVWRLVFDPETASLLVRHEWDTARHRGADEFGVAEFLAEPGAAQAALLRLLFDNATVDA